MQLAFLYIKSGNEAWAEQAKSLYLKKLKSFLPFEFIELKSNSSAREDREKKLVFEAQKIQKKLQPQDYVILFDEQGKEFKDSLEFSKGLEHWQASGKRRLVFIIGGAYGVAESIKARAEQKIKLSNLTLNHHVATVTALEQIYRGLTIQKNIPYHNP